MNANDLTLVKTCGACPEQYDVFRGEELVGYLRLRHGHFRADCPYGNTVYETSAMSGDGEFCDDEREFFLSEAKKAIAATLEGGTSVYLTPDERTYLSDMLHRECCNGVESPCHSIYAKLEGKVK